MGIICEVEDGGIGYSSSWIGYDILFYTRAPPPIQCEKTAIFGGRWFPLFSHIGGTAKITVNVPDKLSVRGQIFLVFAKQQQNFFCHPQ